MLIGLSVLCVLGALAQARAHAEAELLTATQGLLMGIPEAWQRGAPRELRINGAQIDVRSGHSQDSLHALLDRAEADCRLVSAGLYERSQRAKRRTGLSDGILRVEDSKEGLVACLPLGVREASWPELAARLEAFSRDGDLEVLGGVRLLRAEARQAGAFFVLVTTQGPVPLLRMFPAQGDAPGLDFEDIPRPQRARRVLSAWQQHGSPAINVYESKATQGQALDDYLNQAGTFGFRRLGSTRQDEVARAMLLERAGRQLVVSAQASPSGALLVVMPLEARKGAL